MLHDAGDARRWRVALTLTAVAGSVDLICYFVLFHIFTAHMSGNTVSAAAALETGNLKDALLHALPIPVFLCGVVLGVVLESWEERAGSAPRLGPTLVIEVAALATFVILADVVPQTPDRITLVLAVTLALPVMTMGLQNTTLRRVGGDTIRTTFITGMLTEFAKAAARALLCRGPWQPATISGSIWVAYLLGAAAGGSLELRWGANAAALPMVMLLLTAVTDGRSVAES